MVYSRTPSARPSGAPPLPTSTRNRGAPSSRAPSASLTATGSAQLPPIQPDTEPSCRMSAFAPGLAEVGRSQRTTVATANGSPRRASASASASQSTGLMSFGDAVITQQLPDLGRRDGDVHVAHPE